MLCPAGTFALNPGSTSCAPCPDGATAPIGSSTCTYVPPPSPMQSLAGSTRSIPADIEGITENGGVSSSPQSPALCPSGAYFISEAPAPKVWACVAACSRDCLQSPHPARASAPCVGLTTPRTPKGALACLVPWAQLLRLEMQVQFCASLQLPRSHFAPGCTRPRMSDSQTLPSAPQEPQTTAPAHGPGAAPNVVVVSAVGDSWQLPCAGMCDGLTRTSPG
jgi:hypothetical protein